MQIYQPQLAQIKVENLRLRAFIGFIDWEKEKLQDVVLSYSFKYDTVLAAETDDVQYAVDYKRITKQIIDLVDNQRFHLVETLAEKVYQWIVSSSPAIQEIKVQVEKPHALRFADNVLVHISSEDRYHSAIIALGSNIDAENNFAKAISELQKIGFVTQRTEFIQTKALKFEDQPDFLNGAVLLQTQKSLTDLKFHLKQIEAILGRVRTENKNAARTIDLDVTTYNGFLIDKEISEFPFLEKFVEQLLG
jgi:dihydroneopterin aldolase/2-amino-4-hydroxy-6-hydroxymethyldihydropteridine diphosphokinase